MSEPITTTAIIKQIVKSTEQWNNFTDIIPKDILCFELAENNVVKAKLGDGVNVWSMLPYINESEENDFIPYQILDIETAVLDEYCLDENDPPKKIFYCPNNVLIRNFPKASDRFSGSFILEVSKTSLTNGKALSQKIYYFPAGGIDGARIEYGYYTREKIYLNDSSESFWTDWKKDDTAEYIYQYKTQNNIDYPILTSNAHSLDDDKVRAVTNKMNDLTYNPATQTFKVGTDENVGTIKGNLDGEVLNNNFIQYRIIPDNQTIHLNDYKLNDEDPPKVIYYCRDINTNIYDFATDGSVEKGSFILEVSKISNPRTQTGKVSIVQKFYFSPYRGLENSYYGYYTREYNWRVNDLYNMEWTEWKKDDNALSAEQIKQKYVADSNKDYPLLTSHIDDFTTYDITGTPNRMNGITFNPRTQTLKVSKIEADGGITGRVSHAGLADRALTADNVDHATSADSATEASKVSQAYQNDNSVHPLLFSALDNLNNTTGVVYDTKYANNMYVKPSEGSIHATVFKGNLSGTATHATSADSATKASKVSQAYQNDNSVHPLLFSALDHLSTEDDVIESTRYSNNIYVKSAPGLIHATTFEGNLSGTATEATHAVSADSATTATSATNADIASKLSCGELNSTNTGVFPVAVVSATTGKAYKDDNSLRWNPQTNTLSATNFNGTATEASKVSQTYQSDNSVHPLLFSALDNLNNTTGVVYDTKYSNNMYVKPSDGLIHATTFEGNLSGTATEATHAVSADNATNATTAASATTTGNISCSELSVTQSGNFNLVTVSSGGKAYKDTESLSWSPSTQTLNATNFNGTASEATHAVSADSATSSAKVQQTQATASANRPLLLSYLNNNTTTTGTNNATLYSNKIHANPNTGYLTATRFIGTLQGTATKATWVSNDQDVLYESTTNTNSFTLSELFTRWSAVMIYLTGEWVSGISATHGFFVPLKRLKAQGSSGIADFCGTKVINFMYTDDNSMRWFEYQSQGAMTYSAVKIIGLY